VRVASRAAVCAVVVGGVLIGRSKADDPIGAALWQLTAGKFLKENV